MRSYFYLNTLGGIIFLTVSLALTKKIDVFLLRNVSPHSVNFFLAVSETHSGEFVVTKSLSTSH